MRKLSEMANESKIEEGLFNRRKRQEEYDKNLSFVKTKIKRDWDVKNATTLPYPIQSQKIDHDSLKQPFKVNNGKFINNYNEEVELSEIIPEEFVTEFGLEDIMAQVGCIIFTYGKDENIYAVVGKDKMHGGGFNNLRKLIGERIVVGGYGRNNESIDIDAILESEYSDTEYCVGRFLKETWNANTRSTIEILIGGDIYSVSQIDDNDDVVYLIATTKNREYEGLHVNEIIQTLKYFNKDIGLKVLLDDIEYDIADVEEDQIACAIVIEINDGIQEGEIVDAIKKIFDTKKPSNKEYTVANFDELNKNDEYYVRYSGAHVEFLGKDDKIARFMNTTINKEMSMPKDKVSLDIVKIKK